MNGAGMNRYGPTLPKQILSVNREAWHAFFKYCLQRYAKLVLRSDGAKEYLRITGDDLAVFKAAKERLRTLDPPLPRVAITDPPCFDNVHYSELADFFCVWQQLYFGDGHSSRACTTRRDAEVQDTEADGFANTLGRVLSECHRVLRDEGLLVFSYHHSREDGWSAVAQAVLGAGFTIVQSQPVKAEMSVAAPKSQAREPIDLDVPLVCRKRPSDRRARHDESEALRRAATGAGRKVARFNTSGRQLSRNDARVVLLGQFLVELSVGRTADEVRGALTALLPQTRDIIEKMWREQEGRHPSIPVAPPPGATQLDLLEIPTPGPGAASRTGAA